MGTRLTSLRLYVGARPGAASGTPTHTHTHTTRMSSSLAARRPIGSYGGAVVSTRSGHGARALWATRVSGWRGGAGIRTRNERSLALQTGRGAVGAAPGMEQRCRHHGESCAARGVASNERQCE